MIDASDSAIISLPLAFDSAEIFTEEFDLGEDSTSTRGNANLKRLFHQSYS